MVVVPVGHNLDELREMGVVDCTDVVALQEDSLAELVILLDVVQVAYV